MNWTPSTGADSYNVYRSTSTGGPYGSPVATDVPTSTYTDLELSNGTTYYYAVSAVNLQGESGLSQEASATPQVPSLPDSPTQLQVAPKGKRKLQLTWSQSPSPGITHNNIYRATTSTGPFSLLATVGATTAYQDANVSSGVGYWYRVTAVSTGGESDFSNTGSGVPR